MGELHPFVEGMRAYRSGEYPSALESLRPLADRDDAAGRVARYYSAMSHRGMGVAALRGERFGEAGWHFRQAIALIGNRADLAEYLFVVCARTGQFERCCDEAEFLAERRPDDPECQVRLAQAQWRAGQRALAMMTLTQALRRVGDSSAAHLNLALFLVGEGDRASARGHLLRAVECDCTSVKAYRYLGMVEAWGGDHAAAAKAFQRACALAPEDLMLAWELSLAAEAAAQAGTPVAVSLPEDVRPAAGTHVRQLAEYAASEPDFVEALLALPASGADLELFEVVASVLRTALADHPAYADLHYQMSVALMRLGDLEASSRHVRRALKINPRYAKALVHLADLDERGGRPREAVRHFCRAVRAGADWADVHLRLGELLGVCGKTAWARRHYQRALTLNAGYARARRAISALAA